MPCGWRRPSTAGRAYRGCGGARLSCEMRFRSRHLSWAREDALRMASSLNSGSCLSRARGCPPFLRNAFPIAASIAGARPAGRAGGVAHSFPAHCGRRAPPTNRFTCLLIFFRTARGRAFVKKPEGFIFLSRAERFRFCIGYVLRYLSRVREDALRMASSISSESDLSRERGRLERTKKGVEVCTVFSLQTCHGARGRTPLRSSA